TWLCRPSAICPPPSTTKPFDFHLSPEPECVLVEREQPGKVIRGDDDALKALYHAVLLVALAGPDLGLLEDQISGAEAAESGLLRLVVGVHQADDVALGVGELGEDQHTRDFGHRHDGLAALALDLVEVGLRIIDRDVKRDLPG